MGGVLALPLFAPPAVADHGGPVTPGAQDITQFCTNPFPENFTDVNATDVFAQAIQCIATAGREIGQPITVGGPEGRPANQYGPGLSVRRGQMASFIARMLDAAESRDRQQAGPGQGLVQALPAAEEQSRFVDVGQNDVHRANINRLAQAGVVLGGFEGRPANTYSPNQFISRAQMASFINRAAAFALFQDPNNSGRSTGFTAPNNADYFVDSGEIAVHQANINGLASVGVVIGVQPTSEHRYAPRQNVTRAQMAGFISRTLAELLDRDRIHSLLEVFTGNATTAARADENIAANANRRLDFAALSATTEFRVTLVTCENVTRGSNDRVTFTQDGNFANTGAPSSRIAGAGAATTLVTSGATGALSVTIENTSGTPECVAAVIYFNGAEGRTLAQGGSSPRLELDSSGRPIEFFGISGRTTFAAGAAQDPDRGQAQVEFSTATAFPGEERVATVTATNGQPITSVAVSGECVNDRTVNTDEGSGADFQVNVTFSTDAREGNCVITFETTFANGSTDTETVTVTVSQRPSSDSASRTVANNGNSTQLRVTFSEVVTLVPGGAAGFRTFSDSTCTTLRQTGTGGDLDTADGNTIRVALDPDEGVAETLDVLFFTVAADSVVDQSGLGNEAIGCTTLLPTP
jgi:hypothetical protein